MKTSVLVSAVIEGPPPADGDTVTIELVRRAPCPQHGQTLEVGRYKYDATVESWYDLGLRGRVQTDEADPEL